MSKTIIHILKAVFISVSSTMALLFLLALLWNRFDLSPSLRSALIIPIYVLPTFSAGAYLGCHANQKSFLHGSLLGFLYFLILLVFSMLLHPVWHGHSHIFPVFLLCICSGTLGGMTGGGFSEKSQELF